MQFGFKNLAQAGDGVIGLNELTVICGPNDTGKTYINYSIYSILDRLGNYCDIGLSHKKLAGIIEDLNAGGEAELSLPSENIDAKRIIAKIEKKIVSDFPSFFRVPEEVFSKLEISLNFPELSFENMESEILEIIPGLVGKISNENGTKIMFKIDNLKDYEFYKNIITNNVKNFIDNINYAFFRTFIRKNILMPFSISSERSGIALFLKLFDRRNNRMIDSVSGKETGISVTELIDSRADFALPIRNNLNIIRDFKMISEHRSKFTKSPKEFNGILSLFSDILRGGVFTSTKDEVMFQPKYKSSKSKPPLIPLHATSSSVKSLFLLDLYINHMANEGHLLVIDEPELNLFPPNQVKMARFVARLVNTGTKVLVTTHSDYFVREINNLIALYNVKKEKEKLMKNFGYENEELLCHKKVSAYNTTEMLKVEEVKVNKFGINNKIFDSIILDDNQKYNEINDRLEEE